MKRAVLVAAAAAVAAVAVASLASAAAPTRGRLIVSNPANNVGTNANTTISALLAPNTFRTTIYIPAGYRAPGGLGQIGNNVGKAQVFARTSTGGRVTLNGQLTVGNVSQAPDTTCESTTNTHAAVWMLKANETKGTATIQFPIYVDTADTNGNVPATAAYMLQYCSGGLGLNVSEVDLDLVRIFNNPTTRGIYAWRAVYDPSATSGKTIAGAGTVGVAADVPISTQVTMIARHVPHKAHWVTLSGRVTIVNQPLGGVKVQLFVGHDRHLALNRPRVTVKTKANGTYRVTLRVTGRRAWYARAQASSPYRDFTAQGCASLQDNVAATNCADATLSAFVVVSNPLKRIY